MDITEYRRKTAKLVGANRPEWFPDLLESQTSIIHGVITERGWEETKIAFDGPEDSEWHVFLIHFMAGEFEGIGPDYPLAFMDAFMKIPIYQKV